MLERVSQILESITENNLYIKLILKIQTHVDVFYTNGLKNAMIKIRTETQQFLCDRQEQFPQLMIQEVHLYLLSEIASRILNHARRYKWWKTFHGLSKNENFSI